MAKQLKNKKITYKVWTSIEKKIEHPDGTEEYVELDQEETRSLGTFTTLKKAREQVTTLGEIHQSDNDDNL